MGTNKSQWPGWVYGDGSDPDYRFSFANERTFLAWIRTALALIAGGVAADVVDLNTSPRLQRALTVVLLVAGLACTVLAWVRWAKSESSMRRSDSLPSGGKSQLLLAVAVSLAGILALVL